ncbi:hypothetical protein HanIR_Chr11g0555891 [Helianthus annuus]|nr:hypothetical protein HanIR_Chr11g0555891 [Helianthus annuus]
MNSSVPSGNVSTGAFLSFCFSISKDSCCFGPQMNFSFFLVREVKGAAILEKFSINLR